jgi:TetR/AcrR family transcriptional repressor of uid operon
MSLRHEKKEGTRRRLLEAAAECFSEFGFSGCSVSQIVKRAGVSQGSLYVHFTDKQALILALMEDEYREAIEAFESLGADARLDDVLTLLGKCIQHVGFPINHRLWLMALAEAALNPELNKLQRHLDDCMRSALADVLSRIVGNSHFESNVPDTATVMIYAAVDGLIARKAIDPDFNVERHVPHFNAYVRSILQSSFP